MQGDHDKHPLEGFIRETFGDRLGALLLVGYGEEASHPQASIRVTPSKQEARRTGWLIEVSGNLPHGRQPLVLAALLKLLLSRDPLSAELEFETSEVLSALGWAETPNTQREIERVIRKYFGLSYVMRREGSDTVELGMYTLLTGYDHDDEIEVEGRAATQSLHRVHFHRGFIEGLKDSRMVFAGIDFGRLRPTH
jgi:hypothetical protein